MSFSQQLGNSNIIIPQHLGIDSARQRQLMHVGLSPLGIFPDQTEG